MYDLESCTIEFWQSYYVVATSIISAFAILWFFPPWFVAAKMTKTRFVWWFKRLLNPVYRIGLFTAVFARKRNRFFNTLTEYLWQDREKWLHGRWLCDGEDDIYFKRVYIWRNSNTNVSIHESWWRCLVFDEFHNHGTKDLTNCVMDCTWMESLMLKIHFILLRHREDRLENDSKSNRRNELLSKMTGFDKL
jgi:hypothetical protein